MSTIFDTIREHIDGNNKFAKKATQNALSPENQLTTAE